MLKLVLASVSMLAVSAHHASAADDRQMVETHSGSIISFSCDNCQPHIDETDDVQLGQANQVFHVRQVEDEKKIYRTENWLGGSPVSYVHVDTQPEPLNLASMNDGDVIEDIAPVILDETAVAAIDEDEIGLDAAENVAVASMVHEKKEAPSFEPNKFDLRLR